MTTLPRFRTTLTCKNNTALGTHPLSYATVRFQIYEEVEIGSEVGGVVATDGDSGDLGRVFYSISDNEKLDHV